MKNHDSAHSASDHCGENSVLCSLMLTARAISNSESALGVCLTRTSSLCFERIGFLIYL